MTPEERKAYNKMYREANKERLQAKQKAYDAKRFQTEERKQKLREGNTRYYNTHKDAIKAYQQMNKDKITERQKKYRDEHKTDIITCECGSTIQKRELKRHQTTIKHKEYLNNNINT